jgi:hypothetical protein
MPFINGGLINMLKEENAVKLWKSFLKLDRNTQAILTSLFGILSIGISFFLFQYVPKAEPVVMTSMDSYLSMGATLLFVGGIFLLIVGTTFYSFKTKCKLCKRKL